MKKQAGFSLIELAIVLVIVTIMIGGLAMPLSAQIEARRIAETRKIMEEAREAIFGYAMSHQIGGVGGKFYLPCPASENGRESRAGTECTSRSGFFPWADLGTAAQDAWGNRLHYSLTLTYGSSATGFDKLSTGDQQVCSTSVGGCALGTVASNLPVVLISYGPNGWSARNVNGTTLAAPTSADELENTDTNGDGKYVSRTPSKPGSAAGEFDDLVVWISQDVLISRACLSGGCPP